MIEDQKEKLVNIANHIVYNGLNPLKKILVTPHSNMRYIVLEGNRRITAIKLLENPNLIHSKYNSTLSKFKKLSVEYRKKSYKRSRLLCYEKY